MNRYQLVILIAVVVFAATASVSALPHEAEAALVEERLFEGKIVTVYLDDPQNGSGQVMKDARLEKLADRWMIIGTAMPTGQDGEWDAGLKAGVAWGSGTAFYVFTPEQFDERMKEQEQNL